MRSAGSRQILNDLYEAADLAQLRKRLSDHLADRGFWSVAELTNALQVDEGYLNISRYGWDNFPDRVGRRRDELVRGFVQAALAQGIPEENRRLRWLAQQKRPYFAISGTPAPFRSHYHCELVEDFGLRAFDSLILPVPDGGAGRSRIWTLIEDKSAMRNSGQVAGLLTVYNHLSQLLPAGDTACSERHGTNGNATLTAELARSSDKPVALTSRQREVLGWIAAGKTLNDIADITGMSYATVRFHIESARKRYGYATTQQTVVRAVLDYGLDPLGPA